MQPQSLANPAPPIAMGLMLVVALTVLWDMGSGDLTVMRWIGTPQGFPLRSDWLLQAVLHDTLRQACTVLWGLLGAWARSRTETAVPACAAHSPGRGWTRPGSCPWPESTSCAPASRQRASACAAR